MLSVAVERSDPTIRLGVYLVVAVSAFAQMPPKFVTLEISAPPGLQAGEIRLVDNRQELAVTYLRSDQQHPETPRAMVVVLDLSYADVKTRAWNEVIRAMRQCEATEYVYFYVVTHQGALLPVHGLPERDADTPPTNPPWIDRTIPALERALANESGRGGGGMFGLSPYLEMTARLANFPGRKSLVCLGCLFAATSEWEPGNTAAEIARSTELHHLAEAFRTAGVAVYPVGGVPPNTMVDDNSGVLPPHLFAAFADATGGRMYDSGQWSDAITQAARDSRSSYRIAWLPGQENWDGRRHKLVIRSMRKGVRILGPGWYIADRLEDVEREWRPPIPDSAITNPFDQTDIGVSISRPQKAASALRVEIRVDAANLLLLHQGGRYSGSIAFQALCYTPEGRRMACTEPKLVKLDLSEQERQTALHGGLRFPLDVGVSEASARIRVVVRDEYSGACGSSTFVLNEEH